MGEMVRFRDGESFKHLSFASIPHTSFAASYDIVGSHDIADSHEPDSHEPATHEPATHEPATDEPATHEPATDEPGTDEPGTDEPLRRRWRRSRLLSLANAGGPGVGQRWILRVVPLPGPVPGAPPDTASRRELDAFRRVTPNRAQRIHGLKGALQVDPTDKKPGHGGRRSFTLTARASKPLPTIAGWCGLS